jgi:DNA-binding response OmpR family regulator
MSNGEERLMSSAGSAQRDATPAAMTVLVYSDDVTTRERVRLAIGRRPVLDLPEIDYVECATHRAVVETVDRGGIDVLVLDGEAVPTGGMGICRQLKDEIYECPPILVLTGRPDDAWLASWSRADAALPHPINGIVLAPAVAELMRQRLAQAPVH